MGERCCNCKWWKTDHGLAWLDLNDTWHGDNSCWALGYFDEQGFCDFHNDYCDGGYCCNSWEPSAPVFNKNGWN